MAAPLRTQDLRIDGAFYDELLRRGLLVYNQGGVWYAADPDAVDAVEAMLAERQSILPPLTARQMRWLLAATGLGEVWDAVAAYLRQHDRVAYADLDMHRANDVFRLEPTLEVVGQFRPIAARLAPGIDLTDEAIRAAWVTAAEKPI